MHRVTYFHTIMGYLALINTYLRQ